MTLIKYLIVLVAAATLAYYTYWAATGSYFDIPYVNFL